MAVSMHLCLKRTGPKMEWQNVVMVLLHLLHLGQDGHKLGLRVQGSFLVPEPETKVFARLADINFGVIESRSRTRDEQFPCHVKRVPNRFPELIAYIVEKINKDYPLPFNLKLGFVVLDDCQSRRICVAQALSFLPQSTCPVKQNENSLHYYDVVAVIASTTSTMSKIAAGILGPKHVPQISVFSTSDELTNMDRYPYFMRVLPPDRYQMKMIADLIKMHGWNYVSVVYEADDYGAHAIRQLKKYLSLENICEAVTRKLRDSSDEKEVNDIAQALVKQHRRARVVVAVLYRSAALTLVTATEQFMPKGRFIWIGPESWSYELDDYAHINHLLLDSLLIDMDSSTVPEFDDWLSQQTIASSATSPWFQDDWEEFFRCSIENGTCCVTQTVGHSNFTVDDQISRRGYYYDAVFVIANAVSRLIERHTCNLTGISAKECVTGEELLQEMKATRLNVSTTGMIKIDQNGDRTGDYDVWQVTVTSSNQYKIVRVFKYFSENGKIVADNKIKWTEDNLPAGLLYPMSRCSAPCSARQISIVVNVSCCWECRSCEIMQIVTNSGQTCASCPQFTWPQPPSFTNCIAVSPRRIRFSSWMGVLVTVLAIVGVSVCSAVFVFFFHHRQCDMIKDTCIELSYVLLSAITSAYLSLLSFMVYPYDISCQLQYVILTTSLTMINGSTFARAFHIWQSSRSQDEAAAPPNDQTWRQLLIAFALMSVQVVVCGINLWLNPQWHMKTQYILEDLIVEITCITPFMGMVFVVIFNILLVLMGAILAFRSLHVENNCHESNFIFKCTCFIMVIYTCLLPAYLIAENHMYRKKILIMVILIQSTGVLGIICLSKIYFTLYNIQNVKTGRRFFSDKKKVKSPSTPGKPLLRPNLHPEGSSSQKESERVNDAV